MSRAPISVMIKPASSSCDLRCTYCFYHDVSSKRDVRSYGVMKEEVLENLVKRLMDEAEHFVSIGFQGGEPTLAGLTFFQKLIEFEKQYNKKKLHISHFIQTNGMHLSTEWASFFKENNFLVGISLDGRKELHNAYRITVSKMGTYDKVEQSIQLLKEYGVEFNVLSVVTNEGAKQIKETYKHLKEVGEKFLQFIPCLDPLDETPGQEQYSLTKESYEKYLITLFDLWFLDLQNGDYVSIREFDNLYQMLQRKEPELCTMKGHCSVQNIIESNGDVYPCDFYVIDKYKMGNVQNTSFIDLFRSKEAQTFLKESLYIHEDCKNCKWLKICRGGCRRNQDINGKLTLNYYCSALKRFYEYAIPIIVRFQNEIQK